MKRNILDLIILTLAVALPGLKAGAQTPVERILAQADSARLEYDFPKASDLFSKAVTLDSTVVDREADLMMMCRNGLSMMDYCSQPVAVAKQVFPLKDFLLFYPLPNHSWRKSPNQLDSLGGTGVSQAVYFPEDSRDLYYSALDEDGIRNIYRTFLADSLWSAPTLLGEEFTSSSDEIYPMLSPDGETLYFASDGLYGMGGFDLYVSHWNKENKEWEVPVNMGFPYSSPYDDFLFINTTDGKYSIFASNRECSKDSVCIYVLEYDGMPVRKAISDIAEIKELSSLVPAKDPMRMDNGSAVSESDSDNADTKRYMDKMKEVRSLRDSVSRFSRKLEELRSAYSTASEENKADLSETILERELLLPSLNDSLQRAIKELQDIEMEFLSNGIVLDVGKLQARADKEIVGASTSYTFTRNSYGPAPILEMKQPERKFDYSFQILPEGRFAEDNTLPEGIVYQIQIFTQSRKATIADIRGLSPVFERKSGSRYICYAGLFRTYADALANLNKVKKQGFRSAEIRAWKDREPISVSAARKLEAEKPYTVVFHPANGQSLPEGAMDIIRQSGVDVAKSVENGSVVFRAGPFHDKEEAGDLMAALKALDSGTCSISTD